MNCHFASPFIDENGEFLDLANKKNLTAGLAPTAAPIPRALGLAYASKAFREIEVLQQFPQLSDHGNEVCFCTIGDASTSEGHFWEAINAAGVLQVPLAIFVWDDGYGISVPRQFQTTKGSISEVMKGFQKKDGTNGIDIYTVKAWDYAGMCEVFEAGIRKTRLTHIPALFHVEDATQPQGHSTSGSHERYKSPERLTWEREWDSIKKMREWIIENELASDEELDDIQTNAKELIRQSKIAAWGKYQAPLRLQAETTVTLINAIADGLPAQAETLQKLVADLSSNREPVRRDVMRVLHECLMITGEVGIAAEAKAYYNKLLEENALLYNSHLYHEGPKSPLKVEEIKPWYDDDAPLINGYEILNKYFDELLARNPKVLGFRKKMWDK